MPDIVNVHGPVPTYFYVPGQSSLSSLLVKRKNTMIPYIKNVRKDYIR